MDRSKWRKLIKDVWWSGWVWVGECFFWYQPTRVVPNKRLSVFIVVWWAAAKSVALNHKKWIGKERTKGKNHCESVILTLLFYCLFAVGQWAVVVGPAMQLSWLLPSAAFCMSVLSVLLTYCHRVAYCDGRFVAVNWHVHEITSQCCSVGQALSKAK